MYVGGGGFYLDKGKLITWGSTDDEGQSYVASGKHVVKFFKIIVYLVSSFNLFCYEICSNIVFVLEFDWLRKLQSLFLFPRRLQSFRLLPDGHIVRL